jgi:ribosomal protein S25
MQYIKTKILITEMGVSKEAKNVIAVKFLRKIKNKNVFPLVNSIRRHTVYCSVFRTKKKLTMVKM